MRLGLSELRLGLEILDRNLRPQHTETARVGTRPDTCKHTHTHTQGSSGEGEGAQEHGLSDGGRAEWRPLTPLLSSPLKAPQGEHTKLSTHAKIKLKLT